MIHLLTFLSMNPCCKQKTNKNVSQLSFFWPIVPCVSVCRYIHSRTGEGIHGRRWLHWCFEVSARCIFFYLNFRCCSNRTDQHWTLFKIIILHMTYKVLLSPFCFFGEWHSGKSIMIIFILFLNVERLTIVASLFRLSFVFLGWGCFFGRKISSLCWLNSGQSIMRVCSVNIKKLMKFCGEVFIIGTHGHRAICWSVAYNWKGSIVLYVYRISLWTAWFSRCWWLGLIDGLIDWLSEFINGLETDKVSPLIEECIAKSDKLSKVRGER